MSVTSFQIIKSPSPGGLGTAVNALLGTWQPYGYVFQDDGQYCQAMTQGVPDVNSIAQDAAAVANGATIAVHNSAGADSHNATAEVAANLLTDVKFASTIAMVDDADTVVVHNSAGATVAGTHTAEVAAGALTDVKLASTIAPVANAATVVVHNSAGSVVAGTHTAEVASGALTDVKLASTVAGVTSGLALTGVAPSGSYTTTVTFTVASGVITAIVLS